MKFIKYLSLIIMTCFFRIYSFALPPINTSISKYSIQQIKKIKSEADKGNAQAQNELGYMYAAGQGIKKNNSKGKKYLKKACIQQISDGCIYYHLFYD